MSEQVDTESPAERARHRREAAAHAARLAERRAPRRDDAGRSGAEEESA